MTETSPAPRRTDILALASAAGRTTAQLFIAVLLIATASTVAIVTALAGLLLAAAALMLRFIAPARRTLVPAHVDEGPMTLQARRTPRGWTVE